MANNHGGPRQGQPGTAYGQRTDLAVDRAPTHGAQAPPVTPASPPRPVSSPEDTPYLSDPGDPSVPMTTGLPGGPGANPTPPGRADLAIVRRYLPDLKAAASAEDAPVTFKSLVRFLEGGQ